MITRYRDEPVDRHAIEAALAGLRNPGRAEWAKIQDLTLLARACDRDEIPEGWRSGYDALRADWAVKFSRTRAIETIEAGAEGAMADEIRRLIAEWQNPTHRRNKHHKLAAKCRKMLDAYAEQAGL